MAPWLRFIAILFIFAPFSAMLAEPFFEAVLDRLSVDTEDWAGPFVTALFELFDAAWFRYWSALIIGVGAGVWLHWIAFRFDRYRVQDGPTEPASPGQHQLTPKADVVLMTLRFARGEPGTNGLHVLVCQVKAKQKVHATRITVLANMAGRNASYEIVAYTPPKELIVGETVRFVLLHQRIDVGAFWGEPISVTEQNALDHLSEEERADHIRRLIETDGPLNCKIVVSCNNGNPMERDISMLGVGDSQIITVLDEAKIQRYDPDRIIPASGIFAK